MYLQDCHLMKRRSYLLKNSSVSFTPLMKPILTGWTQSSDMFPKSSQQHKFIICWKREPDRSESCRLPSTTILCPQWSTDASYSILNLSEFLPSPRGNRALIGKAEFRNMLSTLSYHLPEDQFNVLWNRYLRFAAKNNNIRFVCLLELIHQGTLGMTCCHLWLLVRCSSYLHSSKIFKPMTLVYKLVLRLIWKEKNLGA